MNSCTTYLQCSAMYAFDIYTWNTEVSSAKTTSTSCRTRFESQKTKY